MRHLFSSLHCELPQSRDAKLLKDISQQEHLYAGRHLSQLCSLLWTGFLTSASCQTATGSFWAGYTFYLEFLSLSPVFLILNPLKSKFVTKFLIRGFWQKKKAIFCCCDTHLGFPSGFHHYFEPFTYLKKGSHSLLRSGNCIPLT